MDAVLIHRILESESVRVSPKSEVDPQVLIWMYPLIAEGLATGACVPLLEFGMVATLGNRVRTATRVSLAVPARGGFPTARGPEARVAAAGDPDGDPARFAGGAASHGSRDRFPG